MFVRVSRRGRNQWGKCGMDYGEDGIGHDLEGGIQARIQRGRLPIPVPAGGTTGGPADLVGFALRGFPDLGLSVLKPSLSKPGRTAD